jgi:transposase-like protein
MDPTPTCCPQRHCPARGQTGQGNSGIHSQQAQRFRCHACPKTCRATTGTVCDRLRPAAAMGSLVVTWLAPGCPVPAMVAAWGFDARTVADWWVRSGRPGRAGHA